MKSYNGFSPAQRMKALKWLKADKAAKGETMTPEMCEVCGQEWGPLSYHSEDYSEPFGPHIGAYALCYICHMMIHCRFRNPVAWGEYKAALKMGAIYRTYGRNNWTAFRRDFLSGPGIDRPYDVDPSRGKPETLDDIDSKRLKSAQNGKG